MAGAALQINDATVAGSNGTDPITDAIKGGALLPVSKIHDYFTSCLPTPQKGGAVKLPLGMTAPISSKTIAIGDRNVELGDTMSGSGRLPNTDLQVHANDVEFGGGV